MLEVFLIDFLYFSGILAFLFIVGWIYSALFKAVLAFSKKHSKKEFK